MCSFWVKCSLKQSVRQPRDAVTKENIANQTGVNFTIFENQDSNIADNQSKAIFQNAEKYKKNTVKTQPEWG